MTALLQMVILLTVVASATPWLDAHQSPLPTPRRSGDLTLRGHQPRPIFNGSVVAGGVYSPDELRAAIERDPVVAHHYRGADLDEMRPVTLTAGRAAYVSYRDGDRVYWTRGRVWLKAGETVLTDGTTVIRARCGNCVSDVQQEDVAAVEPAHGELDDFVVPPTPDPGMDSLAAEAEAGLGDLLQVPFASALLAALAPGAPLLVPDLPGDPFGPRGVPVFGFPFFVPPGLPGAGGPDGGEIPAPPGAPGAGDPPVPPAGFVPTGDGNGPPDVGTGSSGTGISGTGSSGTVRFDDPGSAASTPEPAALWLIAAGVIAVASRRRR